MKAWRDFLFSFTIATGILYATIDPFLLWVQPLPTVTSTPTITHTSTLVFPKTATLTPSLTPTETLTQTATTTFTPSPTRPPSLTPTPIPSQYIPTITPTPSPTIPPTDVPIPACVQFLQSIGSGGERGEIFFSSSQQEFVGNFLSLNIRTNEISNPLTLKGNHHILPSWSPDGEKLVFIRYINPNYNFYTINADGTDIQWLTNTEDYEVYPNWSPDGTKIVYTIHRDYISKLFIMDTDGSNIREIESEETHSILQPQWMPDGKKILAILSIFGKYETKEIILIDLEGNIESIATFEGYSTNALAISPDGKTIAYTAIVDEFLHIFKIGIHGENLEQLTSGDHHNTEPSWSPDGKIISYTSMRDGNYEIYVMDANGENMCNLTNHPEKDRGALWRP